MMLFQSECFNIPNLIAECPWGNDDALDLGSS